jgi:hypothetical protein
LIDYDALVDAYRRSLTSVLRRFRPGDFNEAFLETWVPDEDDGKSIEGIFEAASAAKVPRVALRLAEATLLRLTEARLVAIGARFGVATLSREGEAIVIDVALGEAEARGVGAAQASVVVEKRAPRPAPGPPVPPMNERGAAYDAAIRSLGPFTHEGARDAAAGSATRVAVDHAGGTLEAWIDAARTIVLARHRGGEGDVPFVLEALCRTIESLPLREAVDHGAARLELALRGRDGARVVPGIVSPANADPRIAACTATLRALLAAYVGSAGPIETKNEFAPPLGEDWASASPAARESRVRAVLPAIARELGFDEGAIELATIHGDARVVLAFTPDVPPARRPLALFEIERALKARVDEGLTVYLEEMADKNRIRRLVVKPGEARG